MATSTGAGKAGLGWLVLAAALAVPGFLFFNWWSHMKADRDRSVATKAKGRLPDGVVFQTPPAGMRPSNPAELSSAPVVVSTPSRPSPLLSAPAVDATTSISSAAATAQTPVVVPQAPLAQAPLVAAVVKSSETPAARFVLPRDPMLSPSDILRLREAEMAKERARLELEEAQRRRHAPRRPVKVVEPLIDDSIDLQGTVVTPNGASLVIVNNATMSLGESFSVNGFSAKVRIVKISSVGVTFVYKKRRFTKSVNPE